jgi:hypothetical protein
MSDKDKLERLCPRCHKPLNHGRVRVHPDDPNVSIQECACGFAKYTRCQIILEFERG